MGDQKPTAGESEARLAEVVRTIKDGKTVWVRKSVSLVRSVEGTPQWIIALIEDITECKQAGEGLFRAMAAGEALNRELEQRVRNRTAEIEFQYKELDELNLIVKQMAGKTIEAMESDRKALSKEIHDRVAGTLAALKIQLENRISRMGPPRQDLSADLMSFEKFLEYLTDAIKETRSILTQLRSPVLEDFDLKSAVEEHIRHFKQFYPAIEILSQIDIVHEGIPDDIQTVVYRVLQEALNNVGKHSAATKVCVNMTTRAGQIRLKIADNGVGFILQTVLSGMKPLMSYGISSMRERVEICNGKFEIRSEPGNGTNIRIAIPI